MKKLSCMACGSTENVIRFQKKDPYCMRHYHQMRNSGRITHLHDRRHGNPYAIKSRYVEFETTHGQKGMVDIEDLHLLKKHYWGVNSQGYLHTRVGRKLIRLHRTILNEPDGVVDHINGNPLDNRRSNLRVCKQIENSRNTRVAKNNKTGVIGVERLPSGKYRSKIMVNRKSIHLGHFEKFEDAVAARLEAERKYFGEFAPQAKG